MRIAASIDDVIAELTARTPLVVVATRARPASFPGAPRARPRRRSSPSSRSTVRPVLILLGTGWGLADALIPSVSRVLAPIEGASGWNHLSVRSAGAIMLDRLFGRVDLTTGR